MVYRIFVEKRPGLSPEASNLLRDLKQFLGISNLEGVRILNRYDVENIDPEVYDHSLTILNILTFNSEHVIIDKTGSYSFSIHINFTPLCKILTI